MDIYPDCFKFAQLSEGQVIRTIIAVLILVIVFGGTFSWDIIRSYLVKRYFATYQPPPTTVSTVKAKAETWIPSIKSVGTLKASNGVSVNAQVDGKIVDIFFKSGQVIKKGQPLIQLDDSIDQQTLKSDQATLQYNKEYYYRLRSVYKTTKGISLNDVDDAYSNYQKSLAAVATDKINIDYKNVKAPFTGKLGIRQVNLGEYITTNTNIVTLQALDPMFIDFTLPQQNLSQVYVGQTIELTTDAYPDRVFKGKIWGISSKVETDTRTFTVRASIPNPNNELLPGVFATVHVLLPKQKKVVTVPQTAVTYSLYGDTAFVVEEKGKDKSGKEVLRAYQRYIKVGKRKGTIAQITKGIKPGEIVVQSGQIKLHNGARVRIDNSLNINK